MTGALLFLCGVLLGWVLAGVFYGLQVHELQQHTMKALREIRDNYEQRLTEMRAP